MKKQEEAMKKEEEKLFLLNDGINKFDYVGKVETFDLKDYIFYHEAKGSYYPSRSYRFYGKRTAATDYDEINDPENNKYLLDILSNILYLFRLKPDAYLKFQAKNIIEYHEGGNTR